MNFWVRQFCVTSDSLFINCVTLGERLFERVLPLLSIKYLKYKLGINSSLFGGESKSSCKTL